MILHLAELSEGVLGGLRKNLSVNWPKRSSMSLQSSIRDDEESRGRTLKPNCNTVDSTIAGFLPINVSYIRFL